MESLEQFADEVEIVALYDPDPAMGQTLAARFHDPSLSPALAPRYKSLPFYDDLEQLIGRERLDLALVTLQNRDAPPAIEQLAAARVHMLIDKPGARKASEARQAFAAVARNGVRATVGLTRHFDPAWLENQPAAIPPAVLRALERSGRHVEQHSEFIPVNLKDGRKLVLPVVRVDMQFVGHQ